MSGGAQMSGMAGSALGGQGGGLLGQMSGRNLRALMQAGPPGMGPAAPTGPLSGGGGSLVGQMWGGRSGGPPVDFRNMAMPVARPGPAQDPLAFSRQRRKAGK